MITQIIPSRDRSFGLSSASAGVSSRSARSAARAFGMGLSLGPLPLALHQSLRRQGPSFRAGLLPGGADAGRVRRHFHSSFARFAGARLRRESTAERGQYAPGIDAALFAG